MTQEYIFVCGWAQTKKDYPGFFPTTAFFTEDEAIEYCKTRSKLCKESNGDDRYTEYYYTRVSLFHRD